MRPLFPSSLVRGLRRLCVVVCVLMLALCAAAPVQAATDPVPSPTATPVVTPARHGAPVRVLLILGGVLGAAAMTAGAVNVFTGTGYWHTAANWSLGTVPTTATSAVVSSTGGIPVLSETTSAVCSNITGGGTIGLCGGGVAGANSLKTSKAAAVALRFCVVDVLVNESSTTVKPQGHA